MLLDSIWLGSSLCAASMRCSAREYFDMVGGAGGVELDGFYFIFAIDAWPLEMGGFSMEARYLESREDIQIPIRCGGVVIGGP